MKTNVLPRYDPGDNPTDCCPRFNPEGWDRQELHFCNKLFVRESTRSNNHVPVDMAEVFEKAFSDIEDFGALDYDDMIVMSRDISASRAEHFFSVSKPVPGHSVVNLSGDYVTRVLDVNYSELQKEEKALVDELENEGKSVEMMYYFYTTCPKCAETYGHNYIVALAKLD